MRPKKYLYSIFLLATLAPMVSAESDINGWRNAKWGLTHTEVKKIYDIFATMHQIKKKPTEKLFIRFHIFGFFLLFYQ